MPKQKKRARNEAINRRQFLKKAGIATAATGALTIAGGFPAILKHSNARAAGKKFDGHSIRVLTWTDITGRAAVEHIIKPFEQETGAKVVSDLTAATSEMVAKVKASAANPQFDLIILSGVGAIELAKAGLLQEPDLNQIPNLNRVSPNLRTGADGFGIGYLLCCEGMLYNTKSFSNAPKSYEVLWDKKHKGRIFLPPAHWTSAMELTIIAARMAGGDERHPDAGFKKLEELKGSVLTLGENIPMVAELFRSGSLDVGAVSSPMLFPKYIRDPNFSLSSTLNLKEGFFYDLQFMVIPKGHPGDNEVTHALIDYALNPKAQAAMAESVWYGPINQDTTLSDKAKSSPYIVTPNMVRERGIRIDQDYLASVRQDWIRRYTEIFGM